MMESWFTCYQNYRNNVTCNGPYENALEADKATPPDSVNSTLLPVFSGFPLFIQEHLLELKYNAIFSPRYRVKCKYPFKDE